ncbi:hypothetical protein EDC01DRAFT_785272 [Geopyxis carbonaria]|nr:hypothetical protein EDC01DRAFT_785272 [Geopyxis carbonaria]
MSAAAGITIQNSTLFQREERRRGGSGERSGRSRRRGSIGTAADGTVFTAAVAYGSAQVPAECCCRPVRLYANPPIHRRAHSPRGPETARRALTVVPFNPSIQEPLAIPEFHCTIRSHKNQRQPETRECNAMNGSTRLPAAPYITIAVVPSPLPSPNPPIGCGSGCRGEGGGTQHGRRLPSAMAMHSRPDAASVACATPRHDATRRLGDAGM